MNESVEARNVESVCRLCLSSEEPKLSVFADLLASVSLATKIQNYLSIEILASDKVSTLICSVCLKRVNEWHTYKDNCLRSQQKLQQCLVERTENVTSIKIEPLDVYEPASPLQGGPWTSDDESMVEGCEESADEAASTLCATVKREVDEENSTRAEGASTGNAQLLLNPVAVAGSKDDRPADLTEKSTRGSKKKVRRGAHTHYRGLRQFKQRCQYCQIYLHSKVSYERHMERFHSGKVVEKKKARVSRVQKDFGSGGRETESAEMVEDVEDELISLEKDAPLTPVQQNIISQLKTFSCYSCQQCFGDRRSTLNHIRQHMPDLRPYTCIACLTEFADRSIYKLHCGASFQCAMKIALVVPEHGTEKYFTCNMCLRSLPNRKELLSHLSKHSDKQYEQLIARPVVTTSKKHENKNIPSPYMNGDPAHNHTCTYCGMVYRYKQNMLKHVSLCQKLPPDGRICYKCANCGMTFLSFNKFQHHVHSEHKVKHLVCYQCKTKFSETSEFLAHYREHEISNRLEPTRATPSPKKAIGGQIRCSLCPNSSFPTKIHLTEHRRIHHPESNSMYSCSICRCNFDKPWLLEAHMADHKIGLIPPVEAKLEEAEGEVSLGSSECHRCGKVFANYQNLRRHVRTVHDTIGRFSCFTCAKTFVREEQWTEHVEKEHKRAEHNCPQCPEVFDSQQTLNVHRRDVHGLNGEDHLACYICGKSFANETSLKIHRGHHFRVNSRLSLGNPLPEQPPKSPRARKSLPTVSARLQCQVCDDRFTDVADLRKHLWDVHCARSKPEKSFISEKFQCELCTNVLPDEESLQSHMKWHESNPILSNKPRNPRSKVESPETQCNLCGKYYSSVANLRKHKKRHKTGTLVVNKLQSKKQKFSNGFTCNVCRKVFAERSSMMRHKAAAHRQTTVKSEVIKPVRPKLDFDTLTTPDTYSNPHKPLACDLCRKIVPDVQALYKHRQLVHKIVNDFGNQVPCTVCSKLFNNISNMRQHYTKVHANRPSLEYTCSSSNCNLVFRTVTAKRNHEKIHASLALPRQNSSPRASNTTGPNTNKLRKKFDLDNYVVKGAKGRQCPVCKITYPNNKALKVHYLKIHENTF